MLRLEEPRTHDNPTAAGYIRTLLSGTPPNGTSPDMGEWAEVYTTLCDAHQTGGADAVRRAWEVLTQARPELAQRLADGQPWPELKPLPMPPTVPPLPDTLLPQPLRSWRVDLAERACIPLEFLAVPALVALSAIVGRTLGIRPNRYDDYIVVPNLWGGIVGGPGTMKTYAVAEGVKPLARLAAEARDAFLKEQVLIDTKRDRLEAEMTAIKNAMVKQAKPRKADTEASSLDALERELQTKKEARAELVLRPSGAT